MRNPKGHRFRDRRMLEDGLLDLDRCDVLAARDDDVFLTIDDPEVPLRIDGSDVAGMEPPAGQSNAGRIGEAPITGHH